MVMLTEEGNEYEVRVKRVPQGTYFKEYVKIGDREKIESTKCDRYIVAEPGQQYEIEITLKNGFEWGSFDSVQTVLYLSGSSSFVAGKKIMKYYAEDDLRTGDAKATIDCVNIDREEQHVGASFTFHDLEIDDQLVNEADVLGVEPKDLASFTVKAERFKWEEGTRTRSTTDSATFWAQIIDKESCKKHGISSSTSLDGPRIDTKTVMVVDGPSTRSERLVFKFHYRNSEFLEQLNIVPYPPPLYCYPWDDLREIEQMITLSDLQLLNRAEHRERTGSLADSGEERKEWRSWHVMNPGQRKYTFEKLQQEHKTYARGEVQKRIAAIPQRRIIVPDEDGPSIGRVESTRFGSQLSNQRSRGARIKQELIDLEAQDKIIREQLLTKGIKTEPIDVDDSQIVVNTIWPSSTIKRCPEDSEKREVKRVKFEEDLPVDMSRYEVFKGDEQGDDYVKTEDNPSTEIFSLGSIDRVKPEIVLESVEEEEVVIKGEEGIAGQVEADANNELEEGEILDEDVKIEGRLAEAIKAFVRGTL